MLLKFEQNRMVRTIQNLEHFQQNRFTILEKSFTPLETINFQTTIFQCSKIYGILTRVIMLKVAPNMADPTSIKYSVSSLKKDSLRRHSWVLLPIDNSVLLPRIQTSLS